jgi:hypothetical protein
VVTGIKTEEKKKVSILLELCWAFQGSAFHAHRQQRLGLSRIERPQGAPAQVHLAATR